MASAAARWPVASRNQTTPARAAATAATPTRGHTAPEGPDCPAMTGDTAAETSSACAMTSSAVRVPSATVSAMWGRTERA